MQYRNYIIFFCSLLYFPLQLSAQKNPLVETDITGLWKGFMYNDTTQKNYRYEIAISENKGKLIGYSHTYFILDDKEYHGVKRLKIKREENKIIIEDVELIVNNYPIPPAKGVHQQNNLILEIKDTVMILSGMYTTNRTRDYHPVTGYVHVERKKDYRQSALVPHLEELGLAKNLSFLKDEANEPAEKAITILKPISSVEEENIIAIAVKKHQLDNNIRPVNAPVVKKSNIIIAEPVKTVDVVVVKPVIQKPPEPVIVKPVVPAIKKPEAVVISKPIPTKPEVAVAVIAPPIKTADPVEAKRVPIKKPDPVDISAAIDINKRKIENIQALYFKSDSLVLTLYDNGEVDGDTVSVLLNGIVIMPKVGLSTNAVKKTIDTKNVGDSIQLIMYAETLGSLPPNTGLLIVYDGTDRYEIRFSGDMQKSSAIVFRRKHSL